MKNRLILRILPNQTDQVQWLELINNNAKIQIPQLTAWRSLPASNKVNEIVLIIPAIHVAIKSLATPRLSHKKLMQAIPYLIEESCAENINNLHISLISINKNDQTDVAVISKNLFKEWLNLLTDYGVQANAVIPDALLLPLHTDDWTLLIEEDLAYLRISASQAFTIDLEMLPELANQLLNQPETAKLPKNEKDLLESTYTKPTIHFYTTHSEQDYSSILNKIDTTINLQITDQALLPLLANNLDGDKIPVNLLQGEFQLKQGPQISQWFTTFFLLGALLVSTCTLKMIENINLKRILNELNTSTLSLYKETFPQATSLVGAQEQISQRLNELTQANQVSPFIYLLEVASLALQDVPQTRLFALSFSQGELGFQVESNSAAALDNFVNQLQRQGVTITEHTVSTQGNAIIGSITIATGMQS